MAHPPGVVTVAGRVLGDTSGLFRLRASWAAVLEAMPPSWEPALRRRVCESVEVEPIWHRMTAAREVLGDMLRRWPGVIHADMTAHEIAERADDLAARAEELGIGLNVEGSDPGPAWVRAVRYIERHHGVAPDLRGDAGMVEQLAGLAARVRCPRWWRRQLRRYVARASEAAAIELGIVGSRTGQRYCTDRTVQRRADQQRANEAALKARKIENGDGVRLTLWDAMQSSVANQAIRRGELMTRIRGAEEIADELGLEGLFWTLTAPSRFHSLDHRTGRRNPRYVAGLDPRQAQAWLRERWALARARLKNRGIRVMGVRVAEPHHDGCPHWHALIWCPAESVETVRDVIARVWLEDDGTEPGARKYRTKWVRMEKGGAAGYVAKYVAKNIDAPLMYDGQAVHLQHVDDEAPTMDRPAELVEGQQVTPAARVEAWAAAWGIRQFQAVGMPSVSVWRELRRVHPRAAVNRGDPELERAYRAAHRGPGRRADWAEYCRAQGGVMLKRSEYRARLQTYQEIRASGYDRGTPARKVGGVETDLTVSQAQFMPSCRTTWGGEGFGELVRAAWTRSNNCAPRRLSPIPEHRRRHGRRYWDPDPVPGPAYFGDRTPFRAIVEELEDRQAASREGVALPALDDERPAVVDAAPVPFGDLVQALAARGQAAPVIVNPRPFAKPSEAPTVERPAADRVEALRARLAARAAGVRPV